MAFPGAASQGCTLAVAVYDGSRQPIAPATKVLYTIRDGNQKTVFRDYRGSQIVMPTLPFYNNFGDSYTVVAWAEGYEQAGFTPVKVAPNRPQRVDLMLMRKDATFHFADATWETLQAKRPVLAGLLACGTGSGASARDRYRETVEQRPAALACLLNITTAMDQVYLRSGSPMQYLRQILWDDSWKQDRFFAYADPELLNQVREAAEHGVFEPEPGSFLYHPGATASYKQTRFGEANVQITFHEEDRQTVGGVDCCKVELDIDYYKDLGAHALLEVVHNSASGSLTDPRQVYLLRWIAGRRAGVPEFDPLYTLA
jgi:hypothetical protein